MNVIILCGKNENQKALANKVSKEANIVGIVIEEKNKVVVKKTSTLVKKIVSKLFFRKIDLAWINLMKYYAKDTPLWPESKKMFIENINDEKVVRFVNSKKTDLIIVSGTRLITEKTLNALFSLKGIINLHTGISPYVKGGPNCTNWCISNNKFQLIGNTIMWINAGIDSGNILTSERTELLGNENLEEIHIKVMEHAHSIYIKSIIALANEVNVSNVKQSEIALGELFLTKNWGFKQKRLLLRNLKEFDATKAKLASEQNITLIPIIEKK